MPRFELPPDLSPEEERAAIAALERTLGAGIKTPSPWALAGRADALRLGALHIRHQTSGWMFRGYAPFARRGTSPMVGRGDSR
ncbi:MAG: hypothetical protein ACRDH9_12350 [Actinomycetota bacterium]